MLDLGTTALGNILLFLVGLRSLDKAVALIADWQSNFKTGAFAGLADDDDLTFVARDNSV